MNEATYNIDLDRFTSWGKDLEFEKNEVEAIGGCKSRKTTIEEDDKMTIQEYNNLSAGDTVSYGLFSNIQYVKEIEINDIKHVVMVDCMGTERTVYKTLFLKYGKV